MFPGRLRHKQSLDRLSRHYTRLVNLYHKAALKLDLLRDQRHKRLSRPQGVSFAEDEVVYCPPEPTASASATEPQALAPVAKPGETAATGSSNTPSGENADRGGVAGADCGPPQLAAASVGVDSHGVAGHALRWPILVDGELVVVGVDPAALTPEQREIEELEAEDDRWRSAVDGKAATVRSAGGPTAALTPPAATRHASALTGDGPIG